METWQAGDVVSNGLRLHYTRTGGDKPPVVLAHGITDSGLCWSPVAASLAPDYDVIMVDARGHGRSEAPPRGYGPHEQAEDLAGVIAVLELHKPAVLGHSMGAATTLVLAATHPDLPGAILLEDPPAWWVDASMMAGDAEHRARMRERFLGFKQMTREEMIAAQRAEQPSWSADELGPWADAKGQFSLDVLSVLDEDNAASVDWQTLLSRIACPALLITADPMLGAIVTGETAAALQALVPQLEIAYIPGAGHNIRREQFARYLAVMREFLAKHTATARA